MRQFGVILQESLRRESEARTILGESRGRRRTLKERLRLTGIRCCGATWGFRHATIGVRHEEEEQGQQQEQQPLEDANSGHASNSSDPNAASSSMNLAAALAAERQYRGSQEPDGGDTGTIESNVNGLGGQVGGTGTAPGTLCRVSLMRLLEETDGGTETEKGVALGNDSVCCVCMGRKKGAAFIPCGHTFCRVCTRELWLNRGSCPLCNRSVLEILDIF